MFTNLPTSKAGDAMGDNSTLMNKIPSEGRTALGEMISQETWARTLKEGHVHSYGNQVYQSHILGFSSFNTHLISS